MFRFAVAVVIASCFLVQPTESFVVQYAPTAPCHYQTSLPSSSSADVETDLLSVELDKPLGMILEEVEEGAANGVFVKELAEEGSAATSEYKDKLQGLKLLSVMGEDVSSLVFDDVMEKLIDAPSPVSIEFQLSGAEEDEGLAIGTPVTISVVQDGKPDLAIDAEVGDNLRKVLLDNGVEVYKGMKQKLGNCGGGGQCTFCAFDFVEATGWEERSEYEDGKLKKSPNARLTCLNNIQGPATIRK